MGRKRCGHRGDVVFHLYLVSVARDHKLGLRVGGGASQDSGNLFCLRAGEQSLTWRNLWGRCALEVLGEDPSTQQALLHSCGLGGHLSDPRGALHP